MPPALPKRARAGASAMDALSDALDTHPPPLTSDKKKEGEETKSGSVCKPKPPKPPDLSYAKGGRVKKTGSAKLHKDELVLPTGLVKQLAKLMK